MKLTIHPREGKSKKEINAVRRAKNIPAIIYSQGKEGEKVVVAGDEYRAAMRSIEEGHLSTTVFTLNGSRKAILKDIQYCPTTYDVTHLDFLELTDNVPVRVSVPIKMVGVAECSGVKLGGFLRQVIRKLRVHCLPKDIPAEFVVDVQGLGMGTSKRLKDISMPRGVRALANLEEVAIIVAKS